MIEDIFIGYQLKENKEQIKHNVNTLRQTFKSKLQFNNCIGLRRKIFYILFTYANFNILHFIMKLITK